MPDSDLTEPTVDASYYVAFGRRSQSDAEFLAAATGVLAAAVPAFRAAKLDPVVAMHG